MGIKNDKQYINISLKKNSKRDAKLSVWQPNLFDNKFKQVQELPVCDKNNHKKMKKN